jgi:hypothetical protein
MDNSKAMKDEYPVMVTSFRPEGLKVSFNSLGHMVSAGALRNADRAQIKALKSLHAALLQKHREQEMKEGK